MRLNSYEVETFICVEQKKLRCMRRNPDCFRDNNVISIALFGSILFLSASALFVVICCIV